MLVELAPTGFEEVDAGTAVEFAVYTDQEGELRLSGRFGDVSATDVAADWETRWRDFHQPVRLGSLWIGPPWRSPPADALAVIVDPGRAFGTGAHATTRLCLELLETLPRGSLVDIGCGSGVLSVAAGKLGFGPLHAVDSDPNAVEATLANARRNGVEVAVRRLDAGRDPLPAADVAVANIALAVVEELLPRVHARWVVTSGYRADDRTPLGREPAVRRTRDGWAADVFESGTRDRRGYPHA